VAESLHKYECADISEQKMLESFEPNEYEEIIEDWVRGYLKSLKKYVDVERLGGKGDKGRDVCAFYSPDRQTWDNYQCKHYANPINLSTIKQEISKLCYHSFRKDYPLPKEYYFVAPKGLSVDTHDILYYHKDELKQSIIDEWTFQENKLTAEEKDKLFAFIATSVDFNIFKHISPNEFIKQFKTTNYFSFRFKQHIKLNPDYNVVVPSEINISENAYINHILDTYSEKENTKINDKNIPNKYVDHFKRQRKFFYSAFALEKITRDACRNNKPFDDIKNNIYDAIIDTVEDSSIENGYKRLNDSLKEARNCQISESNELSKAIGTSSKQGFCHYLANENKVKWVYRNEK